MDLLVVEHWTSVDERIKRAKKSLPWQISLHPYHVFAPHDLEDDKVLTLSNMEYRYKLFEFPKGTSRKMMRYRMRKERYVPADPVHLLAFAEQKFKDMPSFGRYHHYVVGLGGELETVLGAQFGGLNSGMCWFFQHVPQNKRMHEGGEDCRFLAVRPFRIIPR